MTRSKVDTNAKSSARAPKLDRVIETAIYVDDLARAAAFYEQIMELPLMVCDARFRAYDIGGESVFLVFKRGATLDTVHLPGGTIPPHLMIGAMSLAQSALVGVFGAELPPDEATAASVAWNKLLLVHLSVLLLSYFPPRPVA